MSRLVALSFSVAWILSSLAPWAAAAEPQAVEESMHEFMEYVFQPAYKRLKVSLATAPADRAAWKPVKADVLTLAESCNLLLLRKPAEGSAEHWQAHAAAARTEGAALYAAAKKMDHPAARAAWEAMLVKCNDCHKEFEKGKHILTP